MKPTQEALKMQLNLAKFQRNPGGDYNEYFMPSSIRMVLEIGRASCRERV